MFVGTLYIGKTYQTKLNVIGLSKEGAWTSAMDSCGSPGNATPNGNTSPSPNAPTPSVGDQGSPNPQGADFSNANKYGAGAPNGNIAQTGTSQASTSMQQSVTPDMILGGVSKTMKIQESVTCNEPAYDGDLKGFLNAAVAAF
jgi:hypothetical protein